MSSPYNCPDSTNLTLWWPRCVSSFIAFLKSSITPGTVKEFIEVGDAMWYFSSPLPKSNPSKFNLTLNHRLPSPCLTPLMLGGTSRTPATGLNSVGFPLDDPPSITKGCKTTVTPFPSKSHRHTHKHRNYFILSLRNEHYILCLFLFPYIRKFARQIVITSKTLCQ